MELLKTLILGSGPAGYTAAIYAGRSGITPVIYEGIQPGGQLTQTTDVDNFPGYPEGVDGNALMDDLRKQAERFGAQIRTQICTKADLSQRPYTLTFDDGSQVQTQTLIIATGASAKYLGLTKRSIAASVFRPAPLATASSTARRRWPWWAVATRPAKKLPTCRDSHKRSI